MADSEWRVELHVNDTDVDMSGTRSSERNMHGGARKNKDKSGMLHRMSVEFLLNDEPGRSASVESSSSGGTGRSMGGAKGIRKSKSLWSGGKEKERRFVCEQCGCAFGMRSNLKRHISTVHEQRRIFRCELCGAAFGLKQNLCTHVRVKHLKVRAFECEVCRYCFGYKQVLQNHRRSIHGLM